MPSWARTSTIGAYTIVREHVRIGEGTQIGPHCVIEGHTTIGRDNRFFQFSSIGAVPQDKKYAGEPTELDIGDRNTMREFCTFNLGTAQDVGVTRIGDDNWIMAYVHIAHDCQVGNRTTLANNAQLAGHVHLGDWVTVGGLTGVHQFVKIGAHVMVGFGSAVSQDVPPLHAGRRQPAGGARLQHRGPAPARFRAPRIAARKQHAQAALPRRPARSNRPRRAIEALAGEQPAAASTSRDRAFLANATRGIVALSSTGPMDAAAPRFAMVAGEASGDLLAGLLLGGLRARAGPAAARHRRAARWPAHGFEAWWPKDKLAVRGYVEVLQPLPRIWSASATQLAERAAAAEAGHVHRRRCARLQPRPRDAAESRRHPHRALRQPVDLGLARQAHREDPQGGRSHAVHLPFEPEIYAKQGIDATLRRSPAGRRDPAGGAAGSISPGAGHRRDESVVALLPGSRRSEIQYIAPRLFEAAAEMNRIRPGLRFILPVVPGLRHLVEPLRKLHAPSASRSNCSTAARTRRWPPAT